MKLSKNMIYWLEARNLANEINTNICLQILANINKKQNERRRNKRSKKTTL